MTIIVSYNMMDYKQSTMRLIFDQRLSDYWQNNNPQGPQADWVCTGCDWHLHLQVGKVPPLDHSIELPWLPSGGPNPELDQANHCPTVEWTKR